MKKFIVIILALVLALSVCACGKTGTAEPAGQSSGGSSSAPTEDDYVSLTVGLNGLGVFLLGTSPSECLPACSAVYDQVFRYNKETESFESDILSDWHYENDGLSLVMTLKSGIIFSNGDEATPEDLLFSYTSQNERGNKYFASTPIDWDSCRVRDNGDVELVMTQVYSPLLENPVYLLDKKWAQEVGWDSEEWYHPVGSGPYYCDEYVMDSYIVLKLRDSYWNAANTGKFLVDEWTLRNYPDQTALYMEFEQGNLALARLMTASYNSFLKDGGHEGLDAQLITTGVVASLFLDNQCNPYISDFAVRKAIAHAVDWESVNQEGLGNMYIQAKTLAMPGTKYENPNVPRYSYDPDLAKKTLEDAGYKPGDVVINIYAMENYRDFFVPMQYYLEQVGITMNIEYGDTSSALAKWVVEGGTDGGIVMNGNGSVSQDPFTTAEMYASNILAYLYWDDDTLQEKINEALYCPDADRQVELYKDLEQYMYDQYISFPLYCQCGVAGFKTDVFTAQDISTWCNTETSWNLFRLSQAAFN